MNVSTFRITGLLTGIVAAIAALGAWLLPGGVVSLASTKSDHVVASNEKGKSQLMDTLQSPSLDPLDQTSKAQSRRSLLNPVSPTRQSKIPADTRQPKFFTLADQEQKSVVPTCASLAVEFSQVDGVNFLSMHVNVGGSSTIHAIFGAGERFKITCGRTDYWVSILFIDRTRGEVQVSLEKAST
jgi:hypothetical protein